MALKTGTRLGPYEIVAPIGAGGMGEVYKAKDTRLDRTVAIKILPEHLAESPERKQRFEREAKTISQLNHPHICTLHDVGSQDGTDFLVMEHIEGETLAERLKQGPLPLDKALEYGSQITDGLDRAHRNGVVHRDLKPGNIMLTKSGAKLLDFGLAKLVENQPVSGGSDAPTQQRDLTQAQAILGTLAYMAPEQLEAKDVDARTDIFAFGAVLYEMLTGVRAFEGESQASLISAIMSSDPEPVSVRRSMTPPALDHVIRTCLAKDADERWQAAGDVARQLKWIGSAEAQPGPDRVTPRRLPWTIPAAVALALGVILGVWIATPPSPEPIHLSVALPENLRLTGWPQTNAPPIAISPDGTTLAIAAQQGGRSQLFLRDLTSFDVQPVPGTEGATSPFFSPDGEWLGFHANGKLQKVPRSGGATVAICDAPLYQGLGIDWGPGETIVFHWSVFSGLYQVPASGGTPQRITTPDSSNGERAHTYPQFLPDGSILFSLWSDEEKSGVAVLSLETGEWRRILEGAAGAAVYLPTGHLAFIDDPGSTPEARLHAVPFDLERLEVTGPPTPVLGGIDHAVRSGRANVAIAPTGHLAYVPARPVARWLTWVDRDGKSTRLTEEAALYQFPRISPDGRRVAFQLDDAWTLDLERGTRMRQTVGGFVNVPVWAPEGKHIVYALGRRGPWNLFHKPVDAGGDGELLLESERSQFPMSWSPDGNLLAFEEKHPDTGQDIWLLPLDGIPQPFLVSGFNEKSPRFSPKGRFVAYVSNESGRDEVYVQPYPTTGRRWTISTDGGSEPLWAPDGQELFYRNGDTVMAVDVETSEEFRPGTPHLLFEGQYEADIFTNYDISQDGKRFLMVQSETPAAREVRVVQNWFEELKRVVPTDN